MNDFSSFDQQVICANFDSEDTPGQFAFNQIVEACSMPAAFKVFVECVSEFVNRVTQTSVLRKMWSDDEEGGL